MKKGKELVKDFSKNLIHRMVKKDSAGWPPHCATFAYQPVRPCRENSQSEKAVNLCKRHTKDV